MATDAEHINQLGANLEEVLQLLKLHREIGGTSAGRRRGLEVVNKSAIVLLVACWESYVEDLANNSLTFLVDNATSHKIIPAHVLKTVGGKHQGDKAWDLAGNGWKTALRSNLKEVLHKTVLNSPKTDQVNELFEKSVGLKKISTHWRWTGRTVASAAKSLDELIDVRHSIAHTVKHADSVVLDDVRNARDLVARLAVCSSNMMRAHLSDVVGKHPWETVTYLKHNAAN